MLEFITSPAGTALAVACTLVLGYFAIRGIGRREEPEPEHLYIRLKRAKRKPPDVLAHEPTAKAEEK